MSDENINSGRANKKASVLSSIYDSIAFTKETTVSINESLLKYKEIKSLSEKTKLSPLILLSIILACLIIILFGVFEELLILVVGAFYPLYFSFKSLKNRSNDDITRWLYYWIFFTIFFWLESFLYLFIKHIPFYSFIRCIILIMCYIPQIELSTSIYLNVLHPLYLKHKGKIDNISGIVHTFYDDKVKEKIENISYEDRFKNVSWEDINKVAEAAAVIKENLVDNILSKEDKSNSSATKNNKSQLDDSQIDDKSKNTKKQNATTINKSKTLINNKENQKNEKIYERTTTSKYGKDSSKFKKD